MEHLKKPKEGLLWLWTLLALLAFVPAILEAADISSGYTFTAGEKNITHTKLNSQLTGASINTSFFTDKSAAQPASADYFLFYSVANSGFRKTTLDVLSLSNTNLIIGQAEDDTPDTNDFLLTFDTSAGLLKKTTLNGLLTNVNLIINRPELTNAPPGELHYLFESNGVYGKIAQSNVFNLGYRWLNLSTNVGSTDPLTNPPIYSVQTAPTNADMVVLWDAAHQTNKVSTLVGLITNLPPVRPGLTNDDTLMVYSTRTNATNPFGTNGPLSKVTLADLQTNLQEVAAGTTTNNDTLVIFSTGTNASPTRTNFVGKVKLSSLIQKFLTNGIPMVSGLAAQGLHGLSGRPQIVKWYLVCTNAAGDLGYAQNDQVPLETTEGAGAGLVASGGANATQVFATLRTATPNIVQKGSTSGTAAITAVRWNLACEAVYYP